MHFHDISGLGLDAVELNCEYTSKAKKGSYLIWVFSFSVCAGCCNAEQLGRAVWKEGEVQGG